MRSLRQLRYNAAKSKLRVPRMWWRHRGLNPNDIFVASYPRSGSTWLRFLLFETLTHRDAGFEDVNRYIPDVGGQSRAIPLLPQGGRLIKTHESYRRDYERAVYIVRDARDVALSEYAYETAQGWISGSFDEFLDAFVRGKVNGYGPWDAHARSWIDSPLARSGNLLVVRYADLRKETETYLSKIMTFLGVHPDPQIIKAAVYNNNVQNMRKKEQHTPQIGYDPRTNSIAEEKRFVRAGKVGGWRERLTPEQLAKIQEHAAGMLARLGFEDSSRVTEPAASSAD